MLRVAASAGVQQVLDAAGMSAADLADLQRDGFSIEATICKRSSIRVRMRVLRFRAPCFDMASQLPFGVRLRPSRRLRPAPGCRGFKDSRVKAL